MFNVNQQWKDWCNERHAERNHMYQDIIPYSFHLDIAESVALQYGEFFKPELLVAIIYASRGHDLIEDTNVSYNDIKKFLTSIFGGYTSLPVLDDYAKSIAEIIFACTDNRGRNRAERHGGDYWPVLVGTPGAPETKACDRIANARFGKLFNSRMLLTYKEEHSEFKEKIYPFLPQQMIAELDQLLS